MPTYIWSCFACGVANAAASERCNNCGCSARPTCAEIKAAKAAVGLVEPVDGPTLNELSAAFWNYLTGRKSDEGFFATILFEVFSYVVLGCVLSVILKGCKSFGFFG
jgi:hypothetical protein